MPYGRFIERPTAPSQLARRISPNLFRQQRLLIKMATYRPLAVLASIWVVLLTIALLAYGQLLRTTPDTDEQSVAPSVEVYPHERPTADDTPTEATSSAPTTASQPVDAQAIAVQAEEDALPGDPQTGLNIWTLLILVGTCAAGSWLLSVQLKRPRKPRSSHQPAQSSSTRAKWLRRRVRKPAPAAPAARHRKSVWLRMIPRFPWSSPRLKPQLSQLRYLDSSRTLQQGALAILRRRSLRMLR